MAQADINKILGTIADKYNVTDHVDGMQHDPSDMVTTNFKQEYTVIIRKKQYYAITAGSGNLDKYTKMYQINNFSSISTSINVHGSAGSCSITIAGNTKIICAERDKQDQFGWGSGTIGFENILKGWAEDIDDNSTTMDPRGDYVYNDMLFDNIDDMKEMKYGWKVTEKCDFEPMDEVYIFSKSRKVKENGKYKVFQIFFGYISDVTKSYSAGATNPIVSIKADDHLKLLEVSYMANTPALASAVALVGAHYSSDFAGNLIIDDNPLPPENGENKPEYTAGLFTTVFAGRYPSEIVTKCAQDAGIPNEFLQKRIEPVKRIPFMPQLKNGSQPYEMFSADLKTRLSYCVDAATNLFMEFFADEEGNLVFKIPNYTLGVNKLPANNAYIDNILSSSEKDAMTKTGTHEETVTKTVTTYETITETLSETITHKVVRGDTLWDLATKYLGNSSKWTEIYDINRDKIRDPHWIYPGQVLYIKKGVTQSKQVAVNKTITEKQTVNGGTLSSITDKYIPVIEDKEVISFVLTDSDQQIVNCFQIKQEVPLIQSQLEQNQSFSITRVVQDWASIIRFGMRSAKMVSTPLLDSVVGPVLFGTMMVQQSLSQRYRGTLTIIEEASIRVGDPIRMFMYDEHPYKFDNSQLNNGPWQAVFYVESIDRDIKPDGVSTMRLSLSAGRTMAMESIYDKMQLLYGRYYDEPTTIAYNPQTNTSTSGTATPTAYYAGANQKQTNILQFAQSFLGTPYKWGGKSPSTGFDCSGFVAYVFNHFGYNLTAYTFSMVNEGTRVDINNLQPADIVFFDNTNHVGIYIGNDQFIHAPRTGDVIKISQFSGYYKQRCNAAIRVI